MFLRLESIIGIERSPFLVVGQVEDHIGKPFLEVGIIGILLVEFDIVGHDFEHNRGQDMIAFQTGVLPVGIQHRRLVRGILRDQGMRAICAWPLFWLADFYIVINLRLQQQKQSLAPLLPFFFYMLTRDKRRRRRNWFVFSSCHRTNIS